MRKTFVRIQLWSSNRKFRELSRPRLVYDHISPTFSSPRDIFKVCASASQKLVSIIFRCPVYKNGDIVRIPVWYVMRWSSYLEHVFSVYAVGQIHARARLHAHVRTYVPPPLRYMKRGKRQTLPMPTAYPMQDRTNSIWLDQAPRSGSSERSTKAPPTPRETLFACQ